MLRRKGLFYVCTTFQHIRCFDYPSNETNVCIKQNVNRSCRPGELRRRKRHGFWFAHRCLKMQSTFAEAASAYSQHHLCRNQSKVIGSLKYFNKFKRVEIVFGSFYDYKLLISDMISKHFDRKYTGNQTNPWIKEFKGNIVQCFGAPRRDPTWFIIHEGFFPLHPCDCLAFLIFQRGNFVTK